LTVNPVATNKLLIPSTLTIMHPNQDYEVKMKQWISQAGAAFSSVFASIC